MPNVTVNGVQIEYETFGDRGRPVILLIMGLGTQMIAWEEEFCEELAERGHFVIRFDNRDVGLSTHFSAAGVPNILVAMKKAAKGEKVVAPYSLDDMADDAAGLVQALGLSGAHVCGASMGGMIAQAMALRHPQLVLSLTSIMSSTGNPQLPPGKPQAMAVLLKPPPRERSAYVEHTVKTWRVIGSPGFPFDEPRIRRLAERSYDRAYDPAGAGRQMMAILAHGNRKPALRSLRVPALVIHGADDPLVPVAAGRDTAEAIPGAELLILPGMGHDLPRELWPQIISAICDLVRRAEAQKTSSASNPAFP